MNTIKKVFTAVISFSAVFFAVVSCDIGLGSSVDTEAPKISITYPPSGGASNTKIRKSFVLGGKWSDDKGLKSIVVSVQKNNVEIDSQEAVINTDKTWQVTLNKSDSDNSSFFNGWQYQDGTYNIKVTAVDGAGHSSFDNATYDIDNTAPVLILSKPASKGTETAKAFGQSVLLEGNFAEDCGKIASLTVSFYDDAGNALLDSTFKDIYDISSASPLVIAQYYDSNKEPGAGDENYPRWENYKTLYGQSNIDAYRDETGNVTKKFYFTVTARDETKVYQDFEGGTALDEGNATETWYRSTSDMANLIKGKLENFTDFNPATLKTYLNKTSSVYEGNAVLQAVLDEAASVSSNITDRPSIADALTNDSPSQGNVYPVFSINPKNNPTYTLSGFVLNGTGDNYTDGFKQYYSGSTINLSVARGTDEDNIDTSSVSFYYTPSGETGRKLLWTWNYETALAYAVAGGLDEAAAAANIAANPKDYRYTKTNSGENSDQLSVTTQLDTSNGEIKVGTKYEFSVDADAKNISGQKLIASDSDGYGFIAASNVNVPEINIASTNGNMNLNAQSAVKKSVFTGGTFGFNGTVSSEAELSANAMTYTVTVIDASDASNKDSDENITVPLTELDKSFRYSWTFNYTPSSDVLSVINSGSGLYIVDVTISATNGNAAKVVRSYYLDTKVPSISGVSISTGFTKDDTVFFNNTKTFTLSGTSTDNYLIGSTSYSFAGVKANGSAYTKSSSAPNTNISWSFENVSLSEFAPQADAADIVLTVTAKDKAGNETVKTFNIEIDTTAPKALHAEDGKGKDVYFRIGETDNDDISESDSLWSDSLDKNTGGKYSGNTFGNATTIRIRGNFKDDGSGVKMIYYKLYTDEPSSSEVNSFFNDYENEKDGYFAPLSAVETKRVFYTGIAENEAVAAKKGLIGNVSNGTNDEGSQTEVTYEGTAGGKYWAKIDSNFNDTISGLSVGKNYIALVAVDNVGNASKDAVTVKTDSGSYKTYNNVSINVDTESPILVCEQSGQQYTNGVNAITVNGTYSDQPESGNSGVKSITVTVNGVAAEAVLYDDEGERTVNASGEYTWTALIPSSTVAALEQGKSYNVNGSIKDNAGNTSSSTLFTLSFDKEAPAVEVSSPSAAAKVNGNITLSGKVTSSGSSPVSLELYVSKTVPSGAVTNTAVFTKAGTITDVSQIYSWSFADIDTYDLTGVASSPVTADLYFIPVVTDGAGNSNIYDLETSSYKYVNGTNYYKYSVDMNSDRPTVKVTNLALTDGAYILKYGEDARIEGTVTDDDSTSTAVVKKFIASTSALTSTAGITSTTDSATGVITSKRKAGTNIYDITTFNPASGEWTFTPADTSDGQKNVYFYILDNADGVFYTGKTETVSGVEYVYHAPYFQYKTSDAESCDEALSYNSDGTAPSVSAHIQAYKADGTTPNGTAVSPGANVTLGGKDKKNAKFIVSGTDANGISAFKLTLSYTSKTDSSAKTYCISSVEGYDGFTKSGTVTGSGTSTSEWTTGLIDLSDYSTGTVSASIEVYDNSGLLGTGSQIFAVDNDGPSVITTAPSSSDELTGDITFSGTSSDTGNAGTVSTSWLIPTAEQAAMSDSVLAAAVDGSGNSVWNSELDNEKSAAVWAFTLEAETLIGYDSATYAGSNISAGVYTLPFYVMTEDSLGNITIDRTKTFKHNPDADRPVTAISYPCDKNYGTDGEGNPVLYVTLGGAIRISGSAVIPSNTTTVNAVYVQVISGSGNLSGSQTVSDKYTLTSDYAASHGLTVVTKAQIESGLGKELTFADDFEWGIKADKTSAWSLTINENDEMSPAAEQLTYIAIRACSVNAEGKTSSWTDWYYINIDDTAPSQEPMLYQFTTTQPSSGCTAADIVNSSNISASRTYVSDMFLKGEWYLTVKLHDESSIDTAKTTVKLNGTTLAAGTGYYVSSLVTGSDGKEKTQYLFIPLDSSASTLTYTVAVSDTDHKITDTYVLRTDNTAPVIEKVYKGSTDNSANYLKNDETNTVADSNYIYTLGGKVDETGSGFKRLVFYFVRANAIDGETYSTEAVLDPLVTTGTSDSKALISGNLTARPFTQGDNTYYLYSKLSSGTLGEDGSSFIPSTPSDVTENAHIRKGGLIEVAGLLRLIEDINTTTGEVSFYPETGITDRPSLPAYFAYAQVVDNASTESLSDQNANPFTFKNNSDDGDLMPETLTGSTSVGYSWDATVHTYNIPDGPCALVVLAFDDAGNVSGKTYPVKVENSAPRLAKVFFGTDLNSNAKWEANEFAGYNVYDANAGHGISVTEVKALQSIATASYGEVFTIKDKLAVIAEIVGGNGDISMVYGRGASTTAAVPSSGTGSGVSAAANDTITSLVTDTIGTVNYNNAEVSTSLKGFTLINTQLVSAVTEANDGTGKSASFTFWDSTDELTAGVNSQNCVLLVTDFTVDLVDSIPPHVVVNPFYWKDLNTNSIYGSSNKSAVTGFAKLSGHIELEGDLTGTQALSLYGSDPKVSGKITFTGTAYDEHSLKNLKFSLTDSSGTALTGFADIAMATYNPASTDETYTANGGWSALSGNSGSALSAGGKYEWTISADNTGSEKSAGYYEDTYYLGQGGHKVYWTVSIDTAQIPDVAKQNVKFVVSAYDGNKYSTAAIVSASAPDKDKTDAKEYNIPSYQIDIVPYVTKVYTGLAKNKKTNWSVYNRTALGHYPVQSVISNYEASTNVTKDNYLNTTDSEDIVLYGFNLNADTAKIVSGSSTFIVDDETELLAITSDSDAGTLTFNAANLASGKPEITVNGITVMNNINGNDSYGDAEETGTAYANWYNRQANGDTNNIQTDDIVFDVWEFNDRAAVPINGLATGICMEVNQTTGMLNYAFANGGLYYSMGGNTGKTTAYNVDNSYSSIYWAADWDTFAGPCVGFHVDELGYTYSVDSGGDTNGSGSVDKWDLYSSRWERGERNTGGTLGGTNALRLEEIALRTGADTFDYSLMKYRYLSAEFASTVSGTSTNLYLVYYDALTNQIRFRAGAFSTTAKQQPGGFTDSYTSGTPVYYATANCQVIANDPSGGTFKTGANTSVTIDGIDGRGAGQYVDVAVVKNAESKDVVCVVWYDQEDNCCKFTYITNPIANWTTLKGNVTALNWSEPVTIFEEGGEYCHIVSDKNNHLHIAAYAGNGDVMYAYLDSYNEYYDADDEASVTVLPSTAVCTVDASGAVGEHLTLDVAVSANGHSIPYIGYYTAAIKKPKYAYLVDKTTGFEQTAAGVDDDERYTGAWEVAVVPSPNRMTTNREDKINVGVWKSEGILTDSKISGAVKNSSRGGTLSGYGSTNWSKTFGNGTSNGVLGYQISTSTGSCLETAQMR
jgi:hypothetical protein